MYVQVFFDGKKCQQGSQTIDLDVDATDMYGPETITMRGLQSETFGYYVHIYTNGVCWDKISANVKIYQASTGGLLHNIKQPGCSESKNCRIHKKILLSSLQDDMRSVFCSHYAEKFENPALFLRLGLLSTQIRHETGVFRKSSSKRRNLKTSAFRFRVDGKPF